jgi:Na+-transporting methylmalonyl-CoA/oxaloacetate decarboxylase gamma subunit
MTAVFLYLLVLFAAFAVVSALLHRETKSDRRRGHGAGADRVPGDRDHADPGRGEERG